MCDLDKNQEYMHHLKVEDVPWHRITTTYGRATDFPEYFDIIWDMTNMDAVQTALNEVIINIEHQSTLWHATPFALIFMVRIFERAQKEQDNNEVAYFIVEQLLPFFTLVAECFHDGDEMEHAESFSNFSDLLNEEYLWSEEYDEQDDEMRYEEEPFPDDLFYSFYYYSYQALLPCKKILENSKSSAKVDELQRLL